MVWNHFKPFFLPICVAIISIFRCNDNYGSLSQKAFNHGIQHLFIYLKYFSSHLSPWNGPKAVYTIEHNTSGKGRSSTWVRVHKHRPFVMGVKTPKTVFFHVTWCCRLYFSVLFQSISRRIFIISIPFFHIKLIAIFPVLCKHNKHFLFDLCTCTSKPTPMPLTLRWKMVCCTVFFAL